MLWFKLVVDVMGELFPPLTGLAMNGSASKEFHRDLTLHHPTYTLQHQYPHRSLLETPVQPKKLFQLFVSV